MRQRELSGRVADNKIRFPEKQLLRIEVPSILVLFDKDDHFLVLHHVVDALGIFSEWKLILVPPVMHVYHYHESELRPNLLSISPLQKDVNVVVT